MKTIRKIMALALVLCMAAAMGVWNTDAHADWYTVQFNKLDNRTFENIPTGVTLTTTAAAPASAADTPAAATAGAAADPQKPGQLEWFYNPWAGTLVIRGRGAMVGFDEKHPAPWHNESKRALRVIIDEGVTTISNEAFKDFIYLRSVVFPSTLKGISATAFEKCEKLKRVEVVTEIKDAEKLIEASKSKELLMDDVKIIRVTKEAVRREICWLTTYWWCRVEIYRDRAGRPIRIIEHKIDGSVIDTGIKYLNEATAVNEAKDPDTAERIYSVRTYPSGAKTAVETEKDEYGRNLIKGDYDLNKDGRQVSGTETTLYGETGLSSEKRTLEKATYKDNGTGTKYWTEVQSNGNTKTILEKVDKNDKILSVETVTYDRNGLVSSRALTENTYNQDGNKTSTSSVEVDNEGKTLSEETTSYSYSGKKLTGMTTETQKAGGDSTKTEQSFTYDKDGNLATATTETVSQSGSKTSTKTNVTSYTYTDTGLKKSATEVETHSDGSVDVTEKKYDKYERPETEKTVEMDKNGKITSTSEREISYNSEHVISESITTTINADGSQLVVVNTYDSDGRLLTASTVDTDAEGKTTSSSTESRTYNADGKMTSNKYESTNEEGKTKTVENKYSFDAQGRELVRRRTTTDYDGTTTVSDTNRSFDANGRIVEEIKETVNPDGTKSGTVTTYTYYEDDTYEETTTPIGEPVVLAAKLIDPSEATTEIKDSTVDSNGTESVSTVETVDTTVIQEEIMSVKAAAIEDFDDLVDPEEGEGDDAVKKLEDAAQETEKGKNDAEKVKDEQDAKEETKDEVKQETKDEVKEETEEETKDEVKEETKDEVKEETKDEVKEETKDEVKEETKDEVKEENKDEVKEENKDEVKEETKEEVKAEPQAAAQGQPQEQVKVQEQPKPQPQEQPKPQEQVKVQEQPQPQAQQDPPPHVHVFVKHVEVQPTCGKNGCRYDEYCCGTQQNYQVIPATGNHSWGEVYTKDDGIAYHACGVCGLEAAA